MLVNRHARALFCRNKFAIDRDIDVIRMNDSVETSSDNAEAITFAVLNAASVLVCLVAVIVVFCLRLHKKLVYRLALYQVLAGLAFATVETLQIAFINYAESPQLYGKLCTAIGWLVVYTQWVKLVFTVWLTVHLFCFGVLHKNLKNLEVLYVVTSLLVPSMVASVPLVTHSYGNSPLSCYIYSDNDSYHIAAIERLTLASVPALVILSGVSVTMVVMVIKLAHTVYLRQKFHLNTESDQFVKALKQLLPLTTFPILFFIFSIPSLIYGIYLFTDVSPNKALIIATSVFISLWSMTSGVSLIVHVSVARICSGSKKQYTADYRNTTKSYCSCDHTVRVETEYVNSATHYSAPNDSLGSDAAL